jgi:hypothetical protein
MVDSLAQTLEVTQRAIAYDDHITAATTVASIGAPSRYMGLAPESDSAVSAATSLDIDLCVVVKHRAGPGRGSALLGSYRNEASALPIFELDRSGARGIDGVVSTHTGAIARPEARATLTNDYLSALNALTGKNFHSKPLGL